MAQGRPRSRQRRGARARLRHPVFFETLEGARGSGMLVELSYSGSLLEAAEPRPAPGDLVRLYVWPEGQAEPFELSGTVVGRREQGFALAHQNPGQALCQWVDALQAAAGGEAEASAEAAEPAAPAEADPGR